MHIRYTTVQQFDRYSFSDAAVAAFRASRDISAGHRWRASRAGRIRCNRIRGDTLPKSQFPPRSASPGVV